MEKELILTAATVEEAMAEARAKYGAEYELSFNILQMPKKGFLGIGAAPAKVQVSLTKSLPEVDLSDLVNDLKHMKMDDEPAQTNNTHNNKPQQKNNQKSAKQGDRKPHESQKPQNPQNSPKKEQNPAPKAAVKPAETAKPQGDDSLPVALRKPAERPAAKSRKDEKKPKPQRETDNRPAEEKKKDLLSAVMGVKDGDKPGKSDFHTVTEKAPAVTESPADTAKEQEDRWNRALGITGDKEPEGPKEDTRRVEFVTPQEMQYALDFANSLFTNMELPARAVHNPDARGEEIPEGMVTARIDIVGDDSGILIGHHGETLDAIQYLMNLCASRKSESAKREFLKIAVDIEGYRGKREDTLRALARRMAAKAVKYKRNVVLEPMNPYERRIIHSEVQGIENVSTHSVGSDENRKIVIVYEGADKAPKKGGKENRRRRGRGEKSEAAKTETTPKAPRPARPDTPRVKPVRAKSIDEIRLDLSEESTVTLGDLGVTDDADVVEEGRVREY